MKPWLYALTHFLRKVSMLLKRTPILSTADGAWPRSPVARRHGMFWGDPKREPNKRGPAVGWNVFANNTVLRRQVFRLFAFHILLCTYLFMVFTSGRKELQFPEYEIRVLSSRWKSFIISWFLQKLKWVRNAESEISLESSLCFSL